MKNIFTLGDKIWLTTTLLVIITILICNYIFVLTAGSIILITSLYFLVYCSTILIFMFKLKQ